MGVGRDVEGGVLKSFAGGAKGTGSLSVFAMRVYEREPHRPCPTLVGNPRPFGLG